MIAGIESGVAATRRISAGLRPLVLDDLGLIAVIEWLAGEFTGRKGVSYARRRSGTVRWTRQRAALDIAQSAGPWKSYAR